MNYCTNCGSKVSCKLPEGDNRFRYVCDSCRTIFYSNPKVVVGAIPVWENKILICRRAIEPAFGKWTLPAGYLENGETLVECAVRETREEAGTQIVDLVPYTVFNIPHISQIYFIFRAEMPADVYVAGAESLEAKLVTPDEIPWSDLAFTSIREVLTMYCSDLQSKQFPFTMVDIPPHA